MKSDYLIGCLENLKSLYDSIQTIMFRIYYVNISEDVYNIYEICGKLYTQKRWIMMLYLILISLKIVVFMI